MVNIVVRILYDLKHTVNARDIGTKLFLAGTSRCIKQIIPPVKTYRRACFA